MTVCAVNPFATRFIRPDNTLFRFACDPELDHSMRQTLIERLLSVLRERRRAAINGPHGTGKTTLLRSIEPDLRIAFSTVLTTRLTSETRHRWRDVVSLVDAAEAPADDTVCLIVDGFEQLPPWDRLRLLQRLRQRKQVSLIVTCHRSPRWIQPCWTTRWDAEIARFLTREKLVDIPAPSRDELLSIFESRIRDNVQPAGNLRDLWFELYDEYEMIKNRAGYHWAGERR